MATPSNHPCHTFLLYPPQACSSEGVGNGGVQPLVPPVGHGSMPPLLPPNVWKAAQNDGFEKSASVASGGGK